MRFLVRNQEPMRFALADVCHELGEIAHSENDARMVRKASAFAQNYLPSDFESEISGLENAAANVRRQANRLRELAGCKIARETEGETGAALGALAATAISPELSPIAAPIGAKIGGESEKTLRGALHFDRSVFRDPSSGASRGFQKMFEDLQSSEQLSICDSLKEARAEDYDALKNAVKEERTKLADTLIEELKFLENAMSNCSFRIGTNQ